MTMTDDRGATLVAAGDPKDAATTAHIEMRVKKRDGSLEPVDLNKICLLYTSDAADE